VQTYGREDNGAGEYVEGDGYCDGWVRYSINKIQAKPMIPPMISNASVQSPIGKVYHTYTYKVTYSDENNDKPKKILITLDNGDIGPVSMTKADKSDKNYQDGVVYKYVIDGSEFDREQEDHLFYIYAEDVDRKIAVFEGSGPIITDNILPTSRPSSSPIYTLYEDDPISYLDLNTTFEDADNDTLYYKLSHNGQNWSNLYKSENISIIVVTIDNQKCLEFRLEENKYNRLSDQSFGSETVYINVSDDLPDKNGDVSRAHYMWTPFELEVVIKAVNDPPELKMSYGEMTI